MTEDMTFTARQNVRHVCVALKKYFEAHLGIKVDEIRREQTNDFIASTSETSGMKVIKPVAPDNKISSNRTIIKLGIYFLKDSVTLLLDDIFFFISGDEVFFADDTRQYRTSLGVPSIANEMGSSFTV